MGKKIFFILWGDEKRGTPDSVVEGFILEEHSGGAFVKTDFGCQCYAVNSANLFEEENDAWDVVRKLTKS